ncbi:hypothetical protein HWI79_3317 [Cryptosporidium felis]|nr:hypothetical protein HWI79_3317 [Cryptosporidium felis]
MCDLYFKEIYNKIKETGFSWEKDIKMVDNLVSSIKMELRHYEKRKKKCEKNSFYNSESQNSNFYNEENNSYYKCTNSGVLLLPTQIDEFKQEGSPQISDKFEKEKRILEKGEVNKNVKNEFCIFDEILTRNSLDCGILRNSTPITSIVGSSYFGCDVNKTQKSPSNKTSSSITFLSKNIGIKKRKLIVPPIVHGRRLKNENKGNVLNQNKLPLKPKRKLKLKGNDKIEEYCVFRDEDYGIIDNTDQVLLNSENVHRQDDDRQTTSEVQEWAIGLVKKYLGETAKLIRHEQIGLGYFGRGSGFQQKLGRRQIKIEK